MTTQTARDAGYVALEAQDARVDENADSTSQPLLASRVNYRRQVEQGGSLDIHEDGTYTYSYGPTGIAGLKHNYYTLLCAFFASIGGLEFGYDQGVIANVLVMEDFVRRWPITPLQKGIMTAVLELGALIGALSAGFLADRYSRRHAIVVACVVFIIGSAFQAGAIDLSHLFIGRAVGGIGVGALSMLSPLYMAEISPPEVRGSLLALEQLSIVLGVVFGFWTGFATRSIPGSASWRIPLAIQIGPGIILALGCLFLPPSPRWLIELLEMRAETELTIRTTGQDPSKSGFLTEVKAWRQLFSAEYRPRTWIGVMIMFFQQWSGINALLYYGPTLVESIGFKGDTVTLAVSGGIGIVQFLAVLPAIVIIDKIVSPNAILFQGENLCFDHRWKRGDDFVTLFHFASVKYRVILLVARDNQTTDPMDGPSMDDILLSSKRYLLVMTQVVTFEDDWAAHRAAAWSAVAFDHRGIYMFTAAYGVSFGPIGWVLPILIGLLTPVFVSWSPSGTFMTFATACFVAYLWATYVVPETANVSLEEMDEVFNSTAGKADSHLKQEIEEDLGLRSLIRDLAEDR
ncbi:monosaccharide transporter [Coprinopsis cinerea okayama7|uniref:Monosaccharide transporter n=1 Tax=Coprinopsis cinerea (strain Okayama-7 / 130 / ATCC MYA-4618 / FGSC 9003) TaxID=240176 RepID=A8N518_COPC7|nr:monosaccharide transporter [Coprinopsis cinerea okayama7\|eukprot:XP_001829907.2 monosaccharide transporter [Coprinopsis cinerea okayama7\